MQYPKIVDSRFELASRTVHVWSVPTVASAGISLRFERTLSPDERERADRFRFAYLRESFIVARGALRVLLGRYLGLSPADIQFTYNGKGKPALAAPSGLCFNASHSGGLALFAFTPNCEIGVDVEQIRPLPDMQNIANRFFCSAEASELATLSANQRTSAFFLCWTRKEAYIKAIGEGLFEPLDGFRVTLQPSQPARFMHLPHDALGAWKLHNLHVVPGYAAALAYRDAERPVALSPLNDPADLLSIGEP